MLVIVRVKTQKNGVLVEEGKKYFAWALEQQFRMMPENQITIIFDFTDAGVSNMDMEVSKFMVTATSIYYPNLIGTLLMNVK